MHCPTLSRAAQQTCASGPVPVHACSMRNCWVAPRYLTIREMRAELDAWLHWETVTCSSSATRCVIAAKHYWTSLPWE